MKNSSIAIFHTAICFWRKQIAVMADKKLHTQLSYRLLATSRSEMRIKMNEQMIVKLQRAKTVQEIIDISKEYGKEVTAEKAQELLDQLNGDCGELSDEELDQVAGGVRIIDAVKEWFGSLFGK